MMTSCDIIILLAKALAAAKKHGTQEDVEKTKQLLREYLASQNN